MMVPLQHSMHFIKLKEFNNPRNQVETSGFNLQKKAIETAYNTLEISH